MLGHRPLTPEDYLAILKKRWWILVIPALLLPILAFAASYLIPPQYLSQTLVLIEQPKVSDTYVKPVIEEDLSSRLASMKEQILSRSRLQPILERFNLFGSQHMTMDERIDSMRKDVDIRPIRSDMAHGLPGFFISFKASDARTAQAVCEEITSLFVNENLRARSANAEGTTSFLEAQMADAKRALDEQDAKLAKFQQQYAGKLPDQDSGNVSMVASLSTQLESSNQALARKQQDREYMNAMLTQQLRELQTPEAQRSTPVAQNTELQELLKAEADLSTRYTDDYPDLKSVRSRIKDLRQKMAQAPPPQPASPAVSQLRNEPLATQQLRAAIRAADQGIAAEKANQARIQGQMGMYQDRISSSPLVQEQYKALTRDSQTIRDHYDDLNKKMTESKMATDLEHRQEGEQFKVMDEANLPDAPFSPKRPMFAGIGAAAGLALGLLIIALIEYRDTALRSERDVWAFTKLPTLAHISRLSDMPAVASAAPAKPRRFFGGRRRLTPALDKPLVGAGG